MKKKLFQRATSIMLVALMTISMMIVSTGGSYAASEKFKLETYETLWAGCEYFSGVEVTKSSGDWINPDKIKFLSVKSSDPKILEVEKSGNWNNHYLIPKKVGKSKITAKFKYKGKTYKVSKTFSVKKYPNPYKSIKVNGKNLNIKKNKYYYDFNEYKKTDTTLKVALNKGWRITHAYYYTDNQAGTKYKEKNLKPAALKKGTTIKIPKNYEGATFIYLENKKGDTIMYGIRFNRNMH